MGQTRRLSNVLFTARMYKEEKITQQYNNNGTTILNQKN
jgi:hypothetical protein